MIWFIAYNVFIVPLMFVIFKLAGIINKKVKDGIKGRSGLFSQLENDLKNISPNKKKVLIHCASVGEWEQAVPIIRQMKKANPDVYVVVSFFSPSGYRYVKDIPEIDCKTYLPFDSYSNAKMLLNLIQPEIFFISKHDIWPNHVYAAGNLNIPAILFAASLPPNSLRHKGLVKSFSKSVYKNFCYIFTISDDDKNRFLKIFPYPNRLIITGDTRFDRVFERGQEARAKAGDIKLFNNYDAPVFITGSIWPTDEKHLMPALLKVAKKNENLKMILVPHEIDEAHLQVLEAELKSISIESERYTQLKQGERTDKRAILIDTVGILAGLYEQCDFAYVGGSFAPGVHNVMEPAVLGLPVIFGPKHLNSFEAIELNKNGGGFAVNSADEIEQILNKMINDPEKRKKAGRIAAKLINNHLGATENIMLELKKNYKFLSKDSD